MQPATWDMRLYRGDTFSATFRLWADTGLTVPVDLAGASVAAQIRDKSAGNVVVDLDAAIDPPGGNSIVVGITAESWSDGIHGPPAPPTGVWDLEVTYASGVVQTVVRGAVTVTGDVTNSDPTTVAAERRSLRDLRTA